MRIFQSIRRPLGGFLMEPDTMALERDLRDRDRERERERKERHAEIARTNRLFGMLLRRMEKIMASMDDVLMSVHAQRGQIDSLVALTGGIKAKLEEALAGGITPAMQVKIDKVFKDLEDNRSAIVKAINANDDDPDTPARIPTTTSLTISPNPSTVGESAAFTATVGSASMDKVITGTVVFAVDGAEVGSGALGPDGVATYTSTPALAEGEHQVTAAYGGNPDFAKSTSSAVTQTVGAAVEPATQG